jgi:surfactin synthase thioesterase subunit
VTPVHDLPAPELIRHLQGLGGFPAALLDDHDALAMLLPVVRHDLRMSWEYRHLHQGSIALPIFVYAASDDPLISESNDLLAWSEVSATPIRHRRFRGGHLYLGSSASELIETLAIDLSGSWKVAVPADDRRHP